MFKNGKKAQGSGAAAAVLVAVIAGLIILYILVMPPAEREKLLGNEENGESSATSADNASVLLHEFPKRIIPTTQLKFEKVLPSFEIFVGEESIILKKKDSLYASRSLFKESKSNISFEIIDLANTKDVQLSFEIKENSGRLIIRLNGHDIFDSEIKTANIEPIGLKEDLVEGINNIEFSVSSPGASFWRTNEYSLKDIMVTATIARKESQESRLKFYIDPEQKEALKNVKVSFYPECNKAEAAKLDLFINDYNLYSAVPDCGNPVRTIEFSPTRLVAGENEITFRTEKGQYFIDQIKLTSELKKIYLPIYYFEINDEQYQNATQGKTNITLYMKFPDDIDQKEADIFVNNHKIRLDQWDIEFEKKINNYITKGNNAVKISPDKTMDIVELKVVIRK